MEQTTRPQNENVFAEVKEYFINRKTKCEKKLGYGFQFLAGEFY